MTDWHWSRRELLDRSALAGGGVALGTLPDDAAAAPTAPDVRR